MYIVILLIVNNKENYMEYENNDVLTFGKIWQFIKKSFATAFIVTLIGAIIGTIVTVSIYFGTKTNYYHNAIVYNYDGISNGKKPNGAEFNKNDIISANILNKAIEETGLSSKITVNQLLSVISVEELYSEKTLNKIKQLEGLVDKDPNAQAQLDKLLKESNPDTYQILYYDSTNKFHLSNGEINKLLNSISSIYIKDFNRKYFKPIQLSGLNVNNLFNSDKTIKQDVEYIDVCNIVIANINNNIKTLKALYTKFPSYTNSNLKSFNDMANDLEETKYLVFSKFQDYITSKNIYKNTSLVKTALQNEIDRLDREIASLTAQITLCETNLNNYKDYFNFSAPSNPGNITLDPTTITNNIARLEKEQMELLEKKESLNKLKLETQKTLTNIDNSTATTEEINQLATNLSNACTNYINQLAKIDADVAQYYGDNHSIKSKSLPMGTVHAISKKTGVVGIVIAAVIGYFLGLLIYTIKVKKLQKVKISK